MISGEVGVVDKRVRRLHEELNCTPAEAVALMQPLMKKRSRPEGLLIDPGPNGTGLRLFKCTAELGWGGRNFVYVGIGFASPLQCVADTYNLRGSLGPAHAPPAEPAHAPPAAPAHAPALAPAHAPAHAPPAEPPAAAAHAPPAEPAHAPAHAPPAEPAHAPAHAPAAEPAHAQSGTTQKHEATHPRERPKKQRG